MFIEILGKKTLSLSYDMSMRLSMHNYWTWKVISGISLCKLGLSFHVAAHLNQIITKDDVTSV